MLAETQNRQIVNYLKDCAIRQIWVGQAKVNSIGEFSEQVSLDVWKSLAKILFLSIFLIPAKVFHIAVVDFFLDLFLKCIS